MEPNDATPVIDFHSHFLVQEVFDQCHCHSPASGFGHHQAPAHLVALFEKMKNPRLVIEDMDRLKIDMSVFSSATVIEPTSWAEPAVELELVRRLGDTISTAHHRKFCPTLARYGLGAAGTYSRRWPWPQGSEHSV